MIKKGIKIIEKHLCTLDVIILQTYACRKVEFHFNVSRFSRADLAMQNP